MEDNISAEVENMQVFDLFILPYFAIWNSKYTYIYINI